MLELRPRPNSSCPSESLCMLLLVRFISPAPPTSTSILSKGSAKGCLSKSPFFSQVPWGHCRACTCWVCGKESVCFSFQFTINMYLLNALEALPRWLSGKESACQCRRCKRRRFDPWVWKDTLEKEMATRSESTCNAGDLGSIPGSGRCPGERNSYLLVWRIPWTEESGGPQSTGSQRAGHD